MIITCGKLKGKEPAPALDLYVGQWFMSMKRAALAMTDRDHIWIISAKYGLLHADQVIPPYEQRLGEPGAITERQVHDQLIRKRIARAVFIGGQSYRKLLASIDTYAPFAKYGKMGYQRAAMKEYCDAHN